MGHAHPLLLVILVSLECILGFAAAEAVRLLVRRQARRSHFRLALGAGLAVYGINLGCLLLQRHADITVPSLAGVFHDRLIAAVLLFPLMAGLGWIGILDAHRLWRTDGGSPSSRGS